MDFTKIFKNILSLLGILLSAAVAVVALWLVLWLAYAGGAVM